MTPDLEALVPPGARLLAPDASGAYPHPYAHAILSAPAPSGALAIPDEPAAPWPVESAPPLLVDSAETLSDMVRHLMACKEMAVDLEAHSFRSFQGFTCLIQASVSRDQ